MWPICDLKSIHAHIFDLSCLLIFYKHFSGRAVIIWSKPKWRRRSLLPQWPKDWEAQAHPSPQRPFSSAWTRDMWLRRGSNTGLAASNPTRTLSSWDIWPGKMHLSQKWNTRFFFGLFHLTNQSEWVLSRTWKVESTHWNIYKKGRFKNEKVPIVKTSNIGSNLKA